MFGFIHYRERVICVVNWHVKIYGLVSRYYFNLWLEILRWELALLGSTPPQFRHDCWRIALIAQRRQMAQVTWRG